MEVLEKIFLGILQASLTASIAAILVILLFKIFNNHIGVRIKNILLILVLIKFLIPAIPETNISLFSILYEKYQNTFQLQKESNTLQQVKDTYTADKEKIENNNYNQNIEIKAKDEAPNIDNQNFILYILKIVSCIWAIGTSILILTLLLFMLNFKRKTKHLENNIYPEIQALIEECMFKANINKAIPFYVYNGFKSPCILGVLKPKIYIPKYILNTNDNNQLSHIFLHELMHYKRKDLLYNFLGIIALSIHWFNPIAWFAVNQMKIYREYACDNSVLELLGEKETIEYGMTLINLSKTFANRNKHSGLAIFFETKNQIKGRVKMIKQFKKGSYKMSVLGIIGCITAATVILTNSINVKALNINNTTLNTESNAVNTNDTPKFLVDSPLKAYSDIQKVEKVAGFKFKLPDFPQANKAESFQLIKLSDQDNALLIYLTGDVDLTFQISEKDPLEYLKKIETVKNRSESLTVESEEQSVKLGDIDGFSVTITATSPTETLKNGQVKPDFKRIHKYFAWKNEGLWYSIMYNSTFTSSQEKGNQTHKISQDNIEKVARSIVYPEEIKNVNYSVEKEEPSTEVATMMIYDKEDLEKANGLLGFNPKFPLKINEYINITGSSVGISSESDIKNNNINYELNNFYSNKGGSITFTEKKNLKDYEDMMKNGYIDMWDMKNEKNIQVKGEKLNINNNEVFKYAYTQKEDNNNSNNQCDYIWKENDLYYSVNFFGNTDNSDKIAAEFINSKPID